ncbi:MAG: TolC family protein [Nitrospina sp.]|jgi:hypothetical protein|nr:TolC family protein [Nitrospina sp.]
MQRILVLLGMLLIASLSIISSSYAGGIQPIPSLNKVLDEARSFTSAKNNTTSLQEKEFLIKKLYYQIQYQAQNLEILNEVKGHFEKSISKAEEKYDEGEEGISQSDITKLKLGLAGTLNDIYEIDTDLQISRLSLSDSLQNKYQPEAELKEPNILPVEFKFEDYQTWVGQNGDNRKDLLLKKAFLKVNEARQKMHLAKKNRKMTRALLISEVANYDFGIGDPGDLFQALIIYTRVLNGYHDSVYNFNLSVAKLVRDKNS